MVLPNIILYGSLLSIGGIVVGGGLWYLDRQDRLRVEMARQGGCGWHDWRALEDGTWLVCGLCGKRSRRLNPCEDRGREPWPSENIFS